MRGMKNILRTRPLVSIIILGFNAKQYLDGCFRSIFAMSYKNIEVLFVDNGSTDGSSDFVKKRFPAVSIFKNKENLGFAGGHEIGFKKAKGDAILTVNTDSFVEKNLLDVLVKELFKSKDIGLVYPKLVMYPNTKKIDAVGTLFSLTGILYHYGREKDASLAMYNKPMEFYAGKGALLMKKEVLKKTGYFDNDYFIYFEETDLCHRIWLAGYRVVYIPFTINFHIGAGVTRRMHESFITFHSEKNRICTYLKNLSGKYLWRVLPTMLFMLQSAFILFLMKGNFQRALSIQRAILWNIVHIKYTLKKRAFVQNVIRKVSDDDFLPKLTKPTSLSYYYHQFFGGMEHYKDEES